MKETKYMLSLGLAYFEQAEMKRLNKKSREGWHLKKLSFMGYILEKGEPEDIVYSVDYRFLKDDESAEYIDMFQLGGWEHVFTEHNLHIFKARRGTKPIYSDNDTRVEKYNRLQRWWGYTSLIFLSMLIISLLIMWQTSGSLASIANIGFSIAVILGLPSVLTYVTVFIRKRKTKKEV